MNPLLIALATFAGGALLLRPQSRAPSGGWQGEIRQLAGRLEERGILVGLGDFLVAVAYWESRGNPRACNWKEGCAPNSARGWFQIRPKTAKTEAHPNKLFQKGFSVAAAADLVRRLMPYAKEEPPTWVAIRRGWAMPSLVDDFTYQNSRSIDVLDNLETSLLRTGQALDFPNRQVVLGPWPGTEEVFKLMGSRAP